VCIAIADSETVWDLRTVDLAKIQNFEFDPCQSKKLHVHVSFYKFLLGFKKAPCIFKSLTSSGLLLSFQIHCVFFLHSLKLMALNTLNGDLVRNFSLAKEIVRDPHNVRAHAGKRTQIGIHGLIHWSVSCCRVSHLVVRALVREHVLTGMKEIEEKTTKINL